MLKLSKDFTSQYLKVLLVVCTGMKVIRHAGVDSRMIVLDNQGRQQMTLHFQLSLQCNLQCYMPDEAHDG